MATNKSPVVRQPQDRGRSVSTPQRGTPSVQSLRWTPTPRDSRDFSPLGNIRSRDFSPHMSPDRVTRNISPGRQRLREHNLEVVSRVPQMYRTSFSAVTSPKRIPRRASPNQSNLTSQSNFMTSQTSFIATPLRATMPGRIQCVDMRNQKSCDSVDKSGTSISNDSRQPVTWISNNSRASATDSPPGGGAREVMSYTPTPPSAKYKPDFRRAQSDDSVLMDRMMSPQSLVNGASPSLAHSSQNADRSYNYIVSTEFPTSTDTGNNRAVSPSGVSPIECAEGEVKIKHMIEKEYVHVQDVSYFEMAQKQKDPLARVADEGSPPGGKKEKKRTRSPFRWIKSRNNSAPAGVRTGVNTNNNGRSSEPNSPAKDRSHSTDLLPPSGPGSPSRVPGVHGRAVRSTTLPSEILSTAGGSPGSPGTVKKSSKKKSKSITSFFQEFKKRLSPKTLRKQLTRADQCKEVTETQDSTGSQYTSQDSCDRLSEDSGADQSGTPTHKGHKSKPIKSCLTSSSDSFKKSSKPGVSPAQNGDAMKETQKNGVVPHPMPNNANASRILRSLEDGNHGDKSVYQAFKDKHSPKLKDLNKEAAALKPQALKVVEFPDRILTEGQGHVEVTKSDSEGQYHPSSRQQRQQQPIGCTGSEPSLGSRNDNHVTGSVNASKRTLVSNENMSPSNRPVTTATTDTEVPPEGGVTSPSNILPNVNDLDLQGSNSPEVTALNFDNSPAKTPSYLNASRLASGYTPYSSYTPVLQARNIRVMRQSDSESDSSLNTSATLPQGQGQSDNQQPQQQPITNGHISSDLENSKCDLDAVDSARILGGNTCSSNSSDVKVTSRTNERPTSCDLGNIASRSSEGEGNGLVEGDLRLNLPGVLLEEHLSQVSSPDTPAKDGHYFLDVMRREEKRLQEMCALAEEDLQDNHGEDVNGKLRATIGKANLLTTKKFKQFRGLCDKCNNPDETDPFPIMPKDLVGFWDMVSIQVEDVVAMFGEIERMRLSGWTQVQTPTTTAKSSVAKGTARKSPRSKATTSQSKRASEASKARDAAREEARKRLLAAKKAGRMRKRSNSDKEEIEIYVQ